MTKNTETAAPWLIVPRPNPAAALRLFCFPYAGGAARVYRSWAEHLPDGVELCLVELPGRGTRMWEPRLTSILSVAEALEPTLLAALDRPFAFFGHSMGAVTAFEVARRLRRRHGRQPAHLFVSGSAAPHLPRIHPVTYDLPEDEFIEHLVSLNGTPREVHENASLMELLLPLLRADFQAVQTYAWQEEPPLSCPVHAFGGLEDANVSRERLAAWREQTTASFSLRMFPGDHFFINTSGPVLLEVLSSELRRYAARPCAGLPRRLEASTPA
ncbi:MAG TPA: alpha/beta fold hydrolase [Pyrinomonadaceae bacterium]|jgi:medium-chain acyl-[acyl-carrier-protein] hydrolase